MVAYLVTFELLAGLQVTSHVTWQAACDVMYLQTTMLEISCKYIQRGMFSKYMPEISLKMILVNDWLLLQGEYQPLLEIILS